MFCTHLFLALAQHALLPALSHVGALLLAGLPHRLAALLEVLRSTFDTLLMHALLALIDLECCSCRRLVHRPPEVCEMRQRSN